MYGIVGEGGFLYCLGNGNINKTKPWLYLKTVGVLM